MILKKKFAAIACAAALALALPTLAWADPSPVGGQDSPTSYQPGLVVSGDNGTLILGNFDGAITGAYATNLIAKTVPTDAQELCSFEIHGNATNVNLTFYVGQEYAGKTVTVFIQHNNGDIERQVKNVDTDGNIAVHVDRLSVFTVVMGDYGDTSTATSSVTKIDTTAKSPKTNADLGGVAGVTALMAVAAGVTFVGLRKLGAK